MCFVIVVAVVVVVVVVVVGGGGFFFSPFLHDSDECNFSRVNVQMFILSYSDVYLMLTKEIKYKLVLLYCHSFNRYWEEILQ